MPHSTICSIRYASDVLKNDPTFMPDLILSSMTVIGILSADWYPVLSNRPSSSSLSLRIYSDEARLLVFLYSIAASTSATNSGCGSSTLLLYSGWNCTPT